MALKMHSFSDSLKISYCKETHSLTCPQRTAFGVAAAPVLWQLLHGACRTGIAQTVSQGLGEHKGAGNGVRWQPCRGAGPLRAIEVGHIQRKRPRNLRKTLFSIFLLVEQLAVSTERKYICTLYHENAVLGFQKPKHLSSKLHPSTARLLFSVSSVVLPRLYAIILRNSEISYLVIE